MSDFFKSRLFWIALGIVIIASTLPLYVSGYILGLLTVAYYFGVFAMAWDLLFGFAGEVNFGPTFLIGVGAYTAGHSQQSIWLVGVSVHRARRIGVGDCRICAGASGACGCAGPISD